MLSHLILISGRPEDTAFAGRVASHNNLQIHQIADCHDAIDEIMRLKPEIILVDGNSDEKVFHLSKELKSRLGSMSDLADANKIHFIASSDLNEAKHITQCEYFGSFIKRTYHEPIKAELAGDRYARIICSQLNPDNPTLEPYLLPGAQIQSIQMKSSKEKIAIVDAIKSYSSKAKFGSRPTTLIANCADELIMNAVFNAPVDPFGKKLFDTTPRDLDFALTGQHEVSVSVGYDGKVLALMVSDLYGSVDKDKIIFHISSAYSHSEYRVKMIAGAGLGLSNIFQTGGSLVFNVEKGNRTDVVALFERTENYRAFKDQFRFFSTRFTY